MTKRKNPVSNRIREKHWPQYVFLTFLSVVILLPFFWLITSSLKSRDQFMMEPMSLPNPVTWTNYVKAYTSINMLNLFKNSLFITVTSVVVSLLFISAAAYVLARFDFRINKVIYQFFLLGMMIPLNAAIIPLFLTLRNIGITNTYLGVIVPYITFQIPIGIFLITNFMKSIPLELEEAAIMDGCNIVQRFIYLFAPLSKSIFATYSIVSFISLWNEFLFALVFLTGDEYKTVPLGLANFRGEFSTNTTVMLAATVIAVLPTIIIYLLLRDHIVKGMTAGAVKG